MKLMFQGPRSFVTDLEDQPTLVDSQGESVVTLPRYGVWRNTGRKFEVVLTTNDLDKAIKEASRD